MAVSYDGLSVNMRDGAPQMSRAVFAAFLAMTPAGGLAVRRLTAHRRRVTKTA